MNTKRQESRREGQNSKLSQVVPINIADAKRMSTRIDREINRSLSEEIVGFLGFCFALVVIIGFGVYQWSLSSALGYHPAF